MACPGRASAKVLDRVVASIGSTAITESDVEKEYRFERFLEGHHSSPELDPATVKETRERLVEQKLLGLESEWVAADPEALQKTALARLAELRAKFENQNAFTSAIRDLGMTEEQVTAKLVEQQRILLLIDQRLRPAAWPDDHEVAAYYRESFVPEYAGNHKEAAPKLSEVENQIKELLVQKKIDQLLANWLTELKSSHRVRFFSP